MLNIVWYRNRYYGKKKFDEIINNCIELGIKIKVKTREYIIFENGDIWKMLCDIGQHEGLKANICYIERAISKEYINSVILPLTAGVPYHAVCFYGEKEEK